MGVQGLARLLREKECLPADSSCIKTLWRGHDFLSQHELARIPPHSTLALDGNGLAYFLHHVAYSRHFAQVTGGNHSTPSTDGCCCKTSTLSETHVTRLLPQYMPLSLLEEVTKEFVESLLRHELKLVVYWDGEARRMKATTTSKRREIRDTEWSRLRQYSMYGVFVETPNAPCRKDWLYKYPTSRLLLQQVNYTLSQFATIEMIQCTEEADREVAMASANDPTCYCVGLDSDYCLFPRTKYVPLNTLGVSGSLVSAVVLTRADIALKLDLEREESIVEFSILMGNDYVGENCKEAQLDFCSRNPEDILEHVQEKEATGAYKVTSKAPQVQLAIDFTRAMYEFQDLSEFPLDGGHVDEEENSYEDAQATDSTVSTDNAATFPHPNRPGLPIGLDLSLAEPMPFDFSIAKVVARTIQDYADKHIDDDKTPIRQEHVDVFVELVETLQREYPLQLNHEDFVRPGWKNVMASYVIERLISNVFRENPDSRLVKISCPSKLFDHARFHSLLKTKSVSEVADTLSPPVNQVDDPKVEERSKLPIDEHEATILDAVDNQRVVIIQGDTGCGKSSRVPVMLLRAPPPDPSMQQVKMFISQPRRIAAKSLVERVRSCEPDLRHSIALRMGHGVREYETSKTRAWFVTTGYLVRLLANHPEKFDDCSHLVVDEVHERSVDTDILCLLCRRLLETNKRIRLVLMSATMAAKLYQEYFGVPDPPIHVGAKRFPIKDYYVEDLTQRFTFPSADIKAAKAVSEGCDKLNCVTPPSNSYMENLFRLAARLVVCIGRSGSSVLIFVPGMNEIIAITDLIEKQYVPGIRYTCYPIHSDVPFEEQMAAFDAPAADEIKVIIATNAAESSVTLPDVDDVICLGLCKQIVYNASSHRQMLMPAWISKASAIQRAGRTGRVRAGNVYRLYTRNAFEESMDQFETGEMLRIPLDSVILTLKEMLQEEATPVLLQCLEPPDLSTIERSFKSLHDSNFITSPNDTGCITTLGKFVSSLGIDLALGSLIGLGIQFGVGAEAIEMAAILSFPKTPWIMTSPLFHDPPEFNDITARTFISRCHFDANLYSEPMAIMNLIWDFERAKNQNGFARHFSLSAPRLRRLVATRKSLLNRVAEFVDVDADSLHVEKPPARMEHAKATLLRVLQVWVFSETMIESIQAAASVDGPVTVSLNGDGIALSHLEQVLDPERHPFDFKNNREISQNGTFTPVAQDDFSMNAFLAEFESRFVSYAVEKSISIFWYATEEAFQLFIPNKIAQLDGLESFCNVRLAKFSRTTLVAQATEQRRGIKERPSGLWDILQANSDSEEEDSDSRISIVKFSCSKKHAKPVTRYLSRQALDLDNSVLSSTGCTFSKLKKTKKGGYMPGFSLSLRGECSIVSQADLHDLLGTPSVSSKTKESQSVKRNVVFSPEANVPMPYARQTASKSMVGKGTPDSSWNRPLLNDIPEGARLLTVLASGRRKEHSIRFADTEDESSPTQRRKRSNGDGTYLEVKLNRDETKISQRWRQFSSDRTVYVAENSVPAAAMSRLGPIEVFACCANTLEVRGGGLRVEGLSLLPPGRLFALLAFLSFGLKPFGGGDDDDSDGVQESNPSVLSQSLRWLNEWDELVSGMTDSLPMTNPDVVKTDRILAAIAFHRSCEDLGETLVCHPEKVRDLCKLFDLVDGNKVAPWKSLDDNPFVEENRRRRGRGDPNKRASRSSATASSVPYRDNVAKGTRREKPSGQAERPAQKATSKKAPRPLKKGSPRETTIVTTFPPDVLSTAPRLFAVELGSGETMNEVEDLPSTNILSVIIKHYCDFLLQNSLAPDNADEVALEGRVSLSRRHWLLRLFQNNDGRKWYTAEFVGTIMPLLSVRTRGQGTPEWIFQGRSRPSTSKKAMECVPSHLSSIPRLATVVSFPEGDSGKVVFFDSVERALQMEAAFWLERQFGENSRHWFQQSLEEMIAKATTLEAIAPRED